MLQASQEKGGNGTVTLIETLLSVPLLAPIALSALAVCRINVLLLFLAF